MPPRRKEHTDKNKEIDSMPELQELQATDEDQQEMTVQGMIDRIEGHYHGHATAKKPAELQGEVLEKIVMNMEEASRVMADHHPYVKAVVSHTTQSTNYGNIQHREPKQGAGSSRAGEVRRSIPTPPSMEERYTPPHLREETGF
ncbi:7-deoxyloganetic acid glucosyltransferase-like [Dorcoceras hygrometricum]|uniref:7-deoxyloganetic acid glucosyltransferase-like n=1 Tax=Dorcoceras hygrometricum TaxID=472368 RepID=A0A2Z7CPP8_9LAMI|nr:7-deoxyloganetic acid glucosyltransferase-like [Dorcoceras hygrometricum]